MAGKNVSWAAVDGRTPLILHMRTQDNAMCSTYLVINCFWPHYVECHCLRPNLWNSYVAIPVQERTEACKNEPCFLPADSVQRRVVYYT